MIMVTTYDAEGRIKQRMRLLNEAEAYMNVPEGGGWIEGRHDAETKWIDNGGVKDRPATGMPKSHTLPRDTDWTVPDVPEGAELVIDGHSAGTVDGDGLVLSFPEPGAYRVELRPPFPWQPATCEVTVQ